MIRRPPRSTLTYTHCPSTTLFRSRCCAASTANASSSGRSFCFPGAPQGRQWTCWERGTCSRSFGFWSARPCSRLCGLFTARRSEEHTSELQSLMRISYAVFCLKKKNNHKRQHTITIKEYDNV